MQPSRFEIILAHLKNVVRANVKLFKSSKILMQLNLFLKKKFNEEDGVKVKREPTWTKLGIPTPATTAARSVAAADF